MVHRRELLIYATLSLSTFPVVSNAQSNSYAMWFQPGSGIQITMLQSTMVVPSVSSGSGFHGVWPGLENDDNGFVYQNVLSDSDGPGQWQFWIEYCCNPNVEYTAHSVSPGDKITSTFSYDVASGAWTDSYSISGSNPASGTTSDSFDVGILDKALLAVELQDGASWDFGKIQWTNVAITALTRSTSWCGNAFAATGSFGYTVSGSSITTTNSTVTCTYNNVYFGGPN